MSKFSIETVSGVLVDPTEPDEKLILLNDAAWAISRINRYSGHTITKIPYSVAQHCIFVANMIWEETGDARLALYGLLHDAAEAYISDIPSPIKRIPELKAVLDPIENRLLDIIYRKYVGSTPTVDDAPVIKKYDHRALLIEAHNFMSSRGKNWYGSESQNIGFIELQNFPPPVPSVQAYQDFMDSYDFYKSELKPVHQEW